MTPAVKAFGQVTFYGGMPFVASVLMGPGGPGKPSGQGTVLVEDLVRCVGVGASVREKELLHIHSPCVPAPGLLLFS